MYLEIKFQFESILDITYLKSHIMIILKYGGYNWINIQASEHTRDKFLENI